MSVIGEGVAAEVSARADRRLAAIDPLLPEITDLPAGCGATFVAWDAEQPAAIAACDHWEGAPGSIGLAWGAARRFRLIPRVAGPNVAAALDELINQWRDHLADVSAADGDDTAAGVNWPSRDAEGIRVLLRHGMAPRGVAAARLTGRAGADREAPSPPPPGVVIRKAGPADIDAVASLAIALVRYDEKFGNVIERAETEALLRDDSAELLATPDRWVWLAERDGVAVGFLAALRPAASTWIAPLTRLAPVAYLQQGFVLPTERGAGAGSLLTAAFHAELSSAGVAVTLLHHSQVNPLSTPFWSQQGYRPLWTTWEARPARTLR